MKWASDELSWSEQSGNVSECGWIPTVGAIQPINIRQLKVLGCGRAAEARLVEATTESGRVLTCVEKVFRPGWLTRLIYRASFQAPFAYQHNRNAVIACFYRRRVAAEIVQAVLPEAGIARPLYVRWDQTAGALVLASEFIRGRGIRPHPVDPLMIRKLLVNRRSAQHRPHHQEREEIQELIGLMTRMEELLVECGLTGSGWQVCPRAMVSTANLLRTGDGYVCVDLESGIPSVLVPRYIREGLRLKQMPLFDDIDPARLRGWLSANEDRIRRLKGAAILSQLQCDVDLLIRHTDAWKQSEPAVGRGIRRLLTPEFRARYRATTTERWERSRIVDPVTAERIRTSRRFFTGTIFLLGLIPGRAGRFIQRVQGNPEFRQDLRKWLTDADYRRSSLARFARRKSDEWVQAGRLTHGTQVPEGRLSLCLNWILSKLTPAAVHRWIVDSGYRCRVRNRFTRICTHSRFQSEYGRLLIRARIYRWQGHSRLGNGEAAFLIGQLNDPATDEYVRGFGLHVGLKLLLPILTPLKIGGTAASIASGNPLYILLALLLLPILRTLITLWRILRSGRPTADFRQALLMGMFPVVGSLAYPVQMYAKFSELSVFLLRDFAGRLGCWLPVYGGENSRTEIAAIKSVNLVAELMDLWISATGSDHSIYRIDVPESSPTNSSARKSLLQPVSNSEQRRAA